ncbi:hypothetical protein QQZ08_004404 [Neonectria magnoliae]|uniref:Acetylesterase n=1 Tax=Neonectria magnoliae TaxID=2732573 RepID=A0ABR1I601_9HYPO
MRIPFLTTGLAVLSTTLVLAADPKRTYFFTFGDSYTKTLWDPAGAPPSDDNPIGNPALPGRTSAGGMNWGGFMVTKFNASSVYLYNFARGGAVVDMTLIPAATYPAEMIDLVRQVQLFNDTLSAAPSFAPWTAQNSIAAIWMGGNDIRATFTILNLPQRHATLMKRYMEQVEKLYVMGVRNFIFLTTARESRRFI